MRGRQIRRQIRRAFFVALFHQIQIVSPILGGIILVMVIIGLLIGHIEGWKIMDALYFTFVTGLTIGLRRSDTATYCVAVSRSSNWLFGYRADRPRRGGERKGARGDGP
jgi:hypothetical protein